MFFVNKTKVPILQIHPISFVLNQQITTIENFGTFYLITPIFFIADVIEIETKNVEKRIYIEQRIVYVNNTNHNQHQNIDTIRTH